MGRAKQAAVVIAPRAELAVTVVSPTSLAGLIRFLIARIDEDDEELRRLRRKLVRGDGSDDGTGVRSLERLQAECAAKRNVIGYCQRLLVLRDLPAERPVRDAASHVLRALAAPYHDHAGYQSDWAK